MARPARDYEPVDINVKLRLHPEHDADLIRWFDGLDGSRAQAVIAALRTGGAGLIDVDVETAVVDDAADLLMSMMM